METIEKNDCLTEDQMRHPHGTEVCEDDDGKCMLCLNGKWVDKDSLEQAGC